MSDSIDQKLDFDGLIGAAEAGDGFDWETDDSEAGVSEKTVSVLRFRIGERRFAVPTEFVREIVSELDVTPVPGAPKHVRGVSVLRRQVIGVLDLHRWLDPVAEVAAVEASRVVIVEAGPYTVGIETNEVTGMDEWPEQVLDRSRIPDSINSRTRRYAAGIRLSEDEACVLLDVPKLLDDAAVQ
ncbi:chemotaxis protein CheW [Persicimonas caeni]|jgi:purine-binding chemotaxis protein CheW|uniref:Chemotaxis protein CheW n=1 Tax=Persicimonas caeni TaxID=2292766 RepID=A0A4Y6PRQ8_PERCE|nr:chemotaxis protein CheW [Persicimonas caeni]QDG51001.1 chemotaxis protein CheW [Persicimonas caeni]QED32222.1 chemotaxis protein CheW [Persicimonas caeni]